MVSAVKSKATAQGKKNTEANLQGVIAAIICE
jgi:hypothetical protein